MFKPRFRLGNQAGWFDFVDYRKNLKDNAVSVVIWTADSAGFGHWNQQ